MFSGVTVRSRLLLVVFNFARFLSIALQFGPIVLSFVKFLIG
jgi:hypothetical protein